MDFAVRIRDLRKEAGLTQEELARQVGVTLNALGNLERGISQDPHYSTLFGIARALDMSVGEFLGEIPCQVEEDRDAE